MPHSFAFSFDNRAFRIVLLFGMLAGLLGMLYIAGPSLTPFLLALGLAFLMEPAVGWISRKQVRGDHVPRWAAVIAVYLVLFCVAVFTLAWTARNLRNTATKAEPALRDALADVQRWLEAPPPAQTTLDGTAPAEPADAASGSLGEYLQANAKNLVGWFTLQLQSHVNDVLGLLTRFVGQLVSVFVDLVLTFMIAAFISSDAPNLVRFFRELVPTSHHASYDDLQRRLDRGLSGVVRGQLLICLINGALTGIALFLLIKPVFAFPLMLLVAVLSMIPIFGTILSSIPCIAMAMIAPGWIDLGWFMQAVLMLGWLVGIHLLESNVLNPKIIGTHAEIHPVLVIFALVVGGHAYGIVGALLAVAVMSIVQNVAGWCHDQLMAAHQRAEAEIALRTPPTNAPRHATRAEAAHTDLAPNRRDGGRPNAERVEPVRPEAGRVDVAPSEGGRADGGRGEGGRGDGGRRDGGRGERGPRGRGRRDRGQRGRGEGVRYDADHAPTAASGRAIVAVADAAPVGVSREDPNFATTPISGGGPASDREGALARSRERDRSRRRGRGRGRGEGGGAGGAEGNRGAPREHPDDRGVYERYRDFE